MGGQRGGIRQRRVYEEPEAADGARVLVDRLWPRGVAKEAAHLDEWCKDVAPSKELRTWYGHRSERYAEFARRYRHELAGSPAREALGRLREYAAAGPLTLLTATKSVEESHLAVLAEVLEGE
ncbi:MULTISPECIES: DUF488 domain-containing protein [Streptomyces]|uniref:DUF488 family protein n=1 Tax=Streptomyces rimosus subsp. rimosus (strain ATCC 10970 / DSM 40260 / JCM 4667 / NRRL 2234) TaxID=1265868 RepID=A0A8A1UHK6_STRR1|nr:MULTISPECIES: DUF488 family protein [Streptomyces]KOG72662.1 hypothetical protein ADK78_19535 [Kitasatospora aureofaciens]MYT47191.1 DUF488 family protein [Streptomyces sp. SID5471]KEF07047.1 hypothetical protein DF17_12095 [Streptomyces rimosus]KEF22076.1 hypothetical protein DF18_01735 [Streptomyces rimosus]KOT35456.1 hypothetical protein ADK84_21575 [Streptomyces sp. NRRL WC-3701]